jgi:hypothetical protein
MNHPEGAIPRGDSLFLPASVQKSKAAGVVYREKYIIFAPHQPIILYFTNETDMIV